MDFMRLLHSVEELLYELITWILFYPLTFWRIVRHPVAMMAYAEKELADPIEQQYDDALSPPVFLLITLFIAHVLEGALHTVGPGDLPGIFADERNLITFRAIAFGLFPLLLALVRIRQRGARLARKTLKPPFYGQCYTAAPFVLSVNLAFTAAHFASPLWSGVAAAILVLGLTWYVGAQTMWFAGAGIGLPRAFGLAVGTILLAFLALLVLAIIAGLILSASGAI